MIMLHSFIKNIEILALNLIVTFLITFILFFVGFMAVYCAKYFVDSLRQLKK